MSYLLGLIGFLLAAVGYLFVKKQSSEALLQNTDVKNKLNELDKDKSKNDGLLASEEQKREELKKSRTSDKNEPVKPGDFN